MYLDGMKVVHPESCTRKIVHRKLYTRKIVHLELPGKLYTEKCTLGKMNTRKNVHSKNISSLGFGRLYKIWPFFAKFWPFSGYFCCRLYKILVFLQNSGLFRAFSKKARISGRGQKFWPEWKHCIWLFLGDFTRKINNAFLAAGSPLGAYGRSIFISTRLLEVIGLWCGVGS